jgi:protein-disulfide isomerase
MIKISDLIIFLFLSGTALAQPATKEEIVVYLSRDGHTKGTANARVALIEFSDFRCSFCRKFWQDTLPLLEKKYFEGEKVKFIYRHFTIFGKPSEAAAQAAECAADQGKFWQYHDKLFAAAGSVLAFSEGKFKGYAKELGLNSQTFDSCIDSGKHQRKVEGESAIAVRLGVRGTPAFLLNGQLVVGAQPIEVFDSLIAEQLKKVASAEKAKS